MARDNSLLTRLKAALRIRAEKTSSSQDIPHLKNIGLGREKGSRTTPPNEQESTPSPPNDSLEDPKRGDTADMAEHSLKVFLTAAVWFQYRSPHLAGTLLYLTAHGAALLSDLSVSLEYLGYVVNAYLKLPKKAKDTFEEVMKEESHSPTGAPDIRFNLHTGILCATVHTWKVPVVSQVLFFKEVLKGHNDLKAFPADRKEELFMIGRALIEDIKNLGGDEEPVREALEQLQGAGEKPESSLGKEMIDFIACAFLEIGKVEKESTTVVFLEFCLQFFPYLSGKSPFSGPIRLPKLSETVHSLAPVSDQDFQDEDDDSPTYVM